MLIFTSEVRWFFAEPLPSFAVTWFCQGDRWIREQARTDRYLVLPGCEHVGVKARQGRLEVKARRGEARVVGYTDAVSGNGDEWVKWSSEHPAPPAWIAAVTSREDRWVDVRKERWMRRFGISSGTVMELERSQPLGADGCNVELTRLTALGEPWWSVSLEAFGHPTGTGSVLEAVAEHFFRTHEAPRPLAEATSLAYPGWLTRLGT